MFCFVFLGLPCQTEFCFLYVMPFEDSNYELAETLGDLNRFLNILFTAFSCFVAKICIYLLGQLEEFALCLLQLFKSLLNKTAAEV